MSGSARVIAIFGPTGSGKTDVAVRVARQLGTDVVNCDPAQCYAGLPILTNQPTAADDAIAPHRLIGMWTTTHVAAFPQFAVAAHETIDELVATRGAAVACGGSGLYLQAALTELANDVGRVHDAELRAQLEARWDAGEQDALYRELMSLDPRVGVRTHPNDRPRVVRGLEVARLGASISPDGASHWHAPQRHATCIIGLAIDRVVIHQRIDERTQRMFDNGVLEEVAALAGEHGERADTAFSVTARKLHGLDDCLGVLRGDWPRDEALERMARRTRQYAKRQDTWARRWPGLEHVAATDRAWDDVVADVLDVARAR